MGARRRNESGAVALLMVFFLVVTMALMAFIIDLGLARHMRREAQNAADSAALAGAAALYKSGSEFSAAPDFAASVAAVKSYAQDNYGAVTADWSACTAGVPTGFTSAPSGNTCIVYDSETQPRRIQVTLPERVAPTLFGGTQGVTNIKVRAAAQAALKVTEKNPCTLCVDQLIAINNGKLYIGGGGDLLAGTGDVKPGGLIDVESPGGLEFSTPPPESGQGTYDPPPLITAAPVPDPFAGTPRPAIPLTGALPLSPTITDRAAGVECDGVGLGIRKTATLKPGVWGNVTISGNTCVAEPGVYFITGRLSMASTSSTKLVGTGVTFYFVCGSVALPRACADTGEAGGMLDNQGQSVLTIGGPAFEPFTIVYHPENTSGLNLAGNSGASILGAVYANSAQMTIGGNGQLNINGQVATHQITLNGMNTILNIYNPNVQRQFTLADVTLSPLT